MDTPAAAPAAPAGRTTSLGPVPGGFRRVTVLGTGVLGAQIAFQAAFAGFDVVSYDLDDAALERARASFARLAGVYAHQVAGADAASTAAALERLRLTSDLADAAREADLVVEAVPEVLALKRELYAALGPLAPERTVFATNSSTLLPSALADATGRPDRFLALHFANHIWVNNTAEVMGSGETDPGVFARVLEFAPQMGMVGIAVRKEKAGYVLNSLLVPLLDAAADLLVTGVADPETIDATWRTGTGAPMGPFQIFDVIGLRTVLNVTAASGERGRAFAEHLQEHYLDRGKLGRESGEGFYRYEGAPASTA